MVTCGFGTSDVDNQLKSQIIQGCASEKLRRDALEKESISLEDLLKMGKTTEVEDVYLKSASSRKDNVCSNNVNGMGINRLRTDRNQYTKDVNSKQCSIVVVDTHMLKISLVQLWERNVIGVARKIILKSVVDLRG